MNKIQEYIGDLSYEEFSTKNIVIDAVVRNLEVIGEAAKNVPVDVREKHAQIPWRQMAGLRNILIHEYFGIDLNIVWTIATKDIPKAKKQIKELIKI
ncbi:HepT-like ribonuclease domain-containing protein [Candidatus Contubernalis alkaliaceticus]|uniref:HepT-like ribonuclease domain-containing protein n=1 Tax=Candidatus Contubernalis alkaliaceticus TaxID=338645 RepID=UPI001F4BE370|nr:DUF86 domain-containing protein [Candidatus Contubernalis alkalaceticus]